MLTNLINLLPSRSEHSATANDVVNQVIRFNYNPLISIHELSASSDLTPIISFAYVPDATFGVISTPLTLLIGLEKSGQAASRVLERK